MFTHDTDNKRNAFRLCPPETAPILCRFKGKTISLIEISAGGASFCSIECEAGDSERVRFFLPGQAAAIEVVMEVLRLDKLNVCSCRFTEIDEITAEAIHRYVLAMQKKYLSGKKKTSLKQNSR